MAASQESSDQTPEPSAAEQLSDENRQEIATLLEEFRQVVPKVPAYQEEVAKAAMGGATGHSTGSESVMFTLPG